MHDAVIREALEEDFETIVSLNEAEVSFTSEMSRERLELLHQLASYHRVISIDGQVVGFLLAMMHDDAYENANFEWFKDRENAFAYIDRVVIDSTFKGRKLASVLYQDLFTWARSLGVPAVVCEYNLVPLNSASRFLHTKFGFQEMGTRDIGEGVKTVSMQKLVL